MIQWIKLGRDLEFISEFESDISALRGAVGRSDGREFSSARMRMLQKANRLERLLGNANTILWKPPGQPPGVGIPRAMVTAYLSEVAEEPAGFGAVVEGYVRDTLTRTRPDLEGKRRRAAWLALIPLYWPFGIAGLLLQALGQFAVASNVVPQGVVSGALSSWAGRLAQAVVTCLELWTFWKLFTEGKLF